MNTAIVKVKVVTANVQTTIVAYVPPNVASSHGKLQDGKNIEICNALNSFKRQNNCVALTMTVCMEYTSTWDPSAYHDNSNKLCCRWFEKTIVLWPK